MAVIEPRTTATFTFTFAQRRRRGVNKEGIEK